MPHRELPEPNWAVVEGIVERLGEEQVIVPVVGVPEERRLGGVRVAVTVLRIVAPRRPAVGAVLVQRDEVHRLAVVATENARLHEPVCRRRGRLLHLLAAIVPAQLVGVGDLRHAAPARERVGPEVKLPPVLEVHRLRDPVDHLGREPADAAVDRLDEARQRVRKPVAHPRIGQEACVVGRVRHRGDRRRVAIRVARAVVGRLHHVRQQVRLQDQRHRRAAGELPDRIHRELQVLEVLHQERPVLQVRQRDVLALVWRHDVVVDDLRHRTELRALTQRLDQLLAVQFAAARSPRAGIRLERRRRCHLPAGRGRPHQRPVVEVDVLRVEGLEARRIGCRRSPEEVLRVGCVGVHGADRQPLRLGGNLSARILHHDAEIPRRHHRSTRIRVCDPQRHHSPLAGERGGVDREGPLIAAWLARHPCRHHARPVCLHLERGRQQCQVGRVAARPHAKFAEPQRHLPARVDHQRRHLLPHHALDQADTRRRCCPVVEIEQRHRARHGLAHTVARRSAE